MKRNSEDGPDKKKNCGPRGGSFGRHRGGPFARRGGPRLFDSGALRLVVMGLIAESPRHGYDIIKALSDRFSGSYSPSPGAIYPMLQALEEADLLVSEMTGKKRLFSLTKAGRDYLGENAAELDKINTQIETALADLSESDIETEVQAFRQTLFRKMRSGDLSADQVSTLKDLLSRTRKEIEDL